MREWYVLTYIMGAIFIAGQIYEYATLVHEGITIAVRRLRLGLLPHDRLPRPARHRWPDRVPADHRPHVHDPALHATTQATGAIVISYYWHFVDVVWIAPVRHDLPAASDSETDDLDARDRSTLEDRTVNALAARRRHPAAIVLLLLLGLVVTGGIYAFAAPKPAQAAVASADDVAAGKKLFLANCSTCHGANAQGGTAGPTLVGRRRGRGRLPGRHRPHAAVQPRACRPMRKPNTVHRRGDAAARGVRRVAGPRSGHPRRGVHLRLRVATIAKGGELFRANCAIVPQLRRLPAAPSPAASTPRPCTT